MAVAEAPAPDHTERQRVFRYGGNTAAMVVLAIAALVIANLLVARFKVRWDLTEQGTYSLSDQTKRIVGGLSGPVQVTGFYTQFSGATKQRAQDLLKEYQVYSDKLQVQFVDPDQNPGQARQLGIQQDGVLVLQSGDRRQDVSNPTESQVTGALLKLGGGTQTTVYFLTGHGERTTEDSSGTGLSMIRSALERDNFVIQPLNLATSNDDSWKQGVVVINDGARVSNVAGRVQLQPASPLLPQEAEKLQAFTQDGGRLLLMLAPGGDASYANLLAPFGLKPGDGVVLDPTAAVGDASSPAVQRPSRHTITEGLPLSIFPQSTGLMDAGDRPQGVIIQPL